MVARGERLDLNVIGACSFADDIPPELVENAIARFRIVACSTHPTRCVKCSSRRPRQESVEKETEE